ncbi:MAG: serine/threonine protein kinase [Deltaproteobacteria bacterium]|nr:serine/threonine protein kinase [Deltaproteobacteria bacterium]
MSRTSPTGPGRPEDPPILGDVRRTQARGTTSRDSRAVRAREVLPNVGEIIGGHYRLVRRLGEGMFGRVFVAERTDVREHRVALKVMTREVYANRNVERELTMLAAASHPHIVQLKDHGVLADWVWLTMPLYEGETLAQRLERGPLGLREAYEVFMPITRGVQALHERGLRHQDIKPENIFLARFSNTTYPVLLDLGVAVEKSSEFVAGTVLYASPEQVMALGGLGGTAGLGERMDTYCLATTLLRALVGEPPEARKPPANPYEIAKWFERRETCPLPPGSLGDLSGTARKKLVDALGHWLHRHASERATAKEMAEALDVLLEQEREAALAVERSLAKQKLALQRVSAALGVMGVLAAGAGFYTFSKRETLRLASELQRVRAEGAASFDKLDTCVASHELERRKTERCDVDRKEAAAEHTRTLASVSQGSGTAIHALERKNEVQRIRLWNCQEDADRNAAAWNKERSEQAALWNGRSAAWDTERAALAGERDEVKRERDDGRRERDDVKRDRDELKRERDDLKRDRDDVKRERDDLKRERDDVRRERDDLKRDRDDVKRERDDLKKAKTSCDATLAGTTEARDQCRAELGSCTEERRACARPPTKAPDGDAPPKEAPPKPEPPAPEPGPAASP